MSVETLLFAVAVPPTAHIPPPGTVVIAANPLSPPLDGLATETREKNFFHVQRGGERA